MHHSRGTIVRMTNYQFSSETIGATNGMSDGPFIMNLGTVARPHYWIIGINLSTGWENRFLRITEARRRYFGNFAGIPLNIEITY